MKVTFWNDIQEDCFARLSCHARNVGFLEIFAMYMRKVMIRGALGTLFFSTMKNQKFVIRLSRKEAKSCGVNWRPLISNFRYLSKVCWFNWPSWNSLSKVVVKLLRLTCSDLSTSRYGVDKQFSIERFLLKSSRLSSRDHVAYLRIKVSFVFLSAG